jgi:hypothetical protein
MKSSIARNNTILVRQLALKLPRKLQNCGDGSASWFSKWCGPMRPRKPLNIYEPHIISSYYDTRRPYNTNFTRCFTWVRKLVSHSKKVHSLMSFKNKVHMRPCGPTKLELVGTWKKLHKYERHKFEATRYHQDNKIKKCHIGLAFSTPDEKHDVQYHKCWR